MTPTRHHSRIAMIAGGVCLASFVLLALLVGTFDPDAESAASDVLALLVVTSLALAVIEALIAVVRAGGARRSARKAEERPGESEAPLDQVAGVATTQGVSGSTKPVGAGWFSDPAGGHQFRYWDGRAWTDHVADDGVAALDPVRQTALITATDSPGAGAPLVGTRDVHAMSTRSPSRFTARQPHEPEAVGDDAGSADTSSSAAWLDDPTGRHERRYWDGERWSDRVADGLLRSTDALAANEPGDSSEGIEDTTPPE